MLYHSYGSRLILKPIKLTLRSLSTNDSDLICSFGFVVIIILWLVFADVIATYDLKIIIHQTIFQGQLSICNIYSYSM